MQVGDYVWWWDTGIAIYGVISAFSRIYDVRMIFDFLNVFVDSPFVQGTVIARIHMIGFPAGFPGAIVFFPVSVIHGM